MTTSEHQLILSMFTQQTRVISALTAVLESQGIVERGDLDAYDSQQAADETHVAGLEQEVKKMYQGFAELLGVKTGLPPAAS